MKISIVVDIVVERSEIFCSMTESSGFYLLDAITETSICVICQFRSASDVELKIQHIILNCSWDSSELLLLHGKIPYMFGY